VDRVCSVEVTRATLAELRAKIAGGQQVVLLSLGATSLEEHIAPPSNKSFAIACNR